MDKRTFLKITGITGTGLMMGPAFIQSCNAMEGKVPEGSWVWYSARGNDDSALSEDLRKMKKMGFEGVHLQAPAETLHKVVPEMAKTGLRVHAWIITMMVSDEKVKKEHPEWYTISRDGTSSVEKPPYVPYYNWLCPTKPAVVDFTTQRVSDLCAVEGLEGVHLDYIRYPDVILPVGLWKKYNLVQDKEYPPFDFCYCEDCRKAFKDQTGRDPLEMEDPTTDEAWRQYRFDSITHLVNHLYDFVHQQGKKLSAAVFPTPEIARKLVRQDWVNWKLDQIHPMIYHNFYNKPPEWIGEATREGTEALQGRIPYYSGVFVPQLTAEDMSGVYQMAKDNGALGVTLFNWRSMTPEKWKTFYV